MNTKVENPKSEIQPDENSFNDKDRLNDLLLSDKHFTFMLSLACQEASNPYLYKEMMKQFEKASQLQRDTYDLLFEMGWYILEKQTPEKIKESFKKFNQQAAQLPE